MQWKHCSDETDTHHKADGQHGPARIASAVPGQVILGEVVEEGLVVAQVEIDLGRMLARPASLGVAAFVDGAQRRGWDGVANVDDNVVLGARLLQGSGSGMGARACAVVGDGVLVSPTPAALDTMHEREHHVRRDALVRTACARRATDGGADDRGVP